MRRAVVREEDKKAQDMGKWAVETELASVRALLDRIDDGFVRACRLILDCQGRVVVTGMGKSGHIAGKIAATFASTGTPSFFMHPAEAGHGDLGMITSADVVLALSNSGETEEILSLLPLIKRLGVPLIAMAGDPDSRLAKDAEACVHAGVEKEACPLELAPTASTTAALVLGDALAVAVLDARGFSKEDFALSHPKGSLGRRLYLRLSDIMHRGDGIPKVRAATPLRDALVEMSAKGLGMTAVVDEADRVQGICTDGDVRRALDDNVDFRASAVSEIMSKDCKTVPETMLAAEALRIMEDNRINALLILREDGVLTGAVNMHDLLRARIL